MSLDLSKIIFFYTSFATKILNLKFYTWMN
jgi:hypothetical protein